MDEVQRKKAIEAALDLYKATKNKRTYNIEYRNQKLDLEVVVIPPQVALLNHDNNRLMAQLLDHPDKDPVQRNPTSPAAQSVISSLLASTSDYVQLRDQLKQLGQKEPGLITRDGLLINGNTRAVALRDLNVNGMLVAVLPEGVLASDIINLEVDLQMVTLTHQDYTFTNQLLLLDRLKSTYSNPADLAKRMSWLRNGTKKVEQHSRILSIINEVRALRSVKLPYSFFDSKAEHLKNLDDDYQRLVALGDLSSAEEMKWTRLSAILLGVAKDQVREIDEDFIQEEVVKRLDNDAALAVLKKEELASPDGLDELVGKDSSEYDPKKFAEILVRQKTGEPSDGGDIPNAEVLGKIEKAMRLGAEEKITEQKLQNYLAEPSDVLRESATQLEKILEKYTQISATAGFDKGKFEFELKKIVKTVEKLQKTFSEA